MRMQLKLTALVGGSARDFNFRPAPLLACLTAAVLALSTARNHAQTDEASPFVVTPAITTNSGVPVLSVAFRVPDIITFMPMN